LRYLPKDYLFIVNVYDKRGNSGTSRVARGEEAPQFFETGNDLHVAFDDPLDIGQRMKLSSHSGTTILWMTSVISVLPWMDGR